MEIIHSDSYSLKVDMAADVTMSLSRPFVSVCVAVLLGNADIAHPPALHGAAAGGGPPPLARNARNGLRGQNGQRGQNGRIQRTHRGQGLLTEILHGPATRNPPKGTAVFEAYT